MNACPEISVHPLKQIPNKGGDVWHALRSSGEGFRGFGEAYFSWVEPDAVKAWKRHRRMTLNLVVPVGCVRFVFASLSSPVEFREEEIGGPRYARLTVPSGMWFGFQGRSPQPSLVLSVADLEHDPEEVDRAPLETFPFNWTTP